MEKIIFYLLSALILVAALAAVSSNRMLRTVIYLLFVLCGLAGVYFLMNYNFLGAVQLTVYAGGIVILLIFSVMLIQHVDSRIEPVNKRRKLLSALLSLAGAATVLFTFFQQDFNTHPLTKSVAVEEVGHLLLSYETGGFILPFEVISVLLLAVMIGGIVIAKAGKIENKEAAS